MTKYVINRCKKYTWILLLVVLLTAISTMASQYIYKFIGYVIDYGLNFAGTEYTGEFAFLFSGKFGEYGSLNLVLTLAICIVLCNILSYSCSYLMWYIQMRGQHLVANGFRTEIYTKSKGKKLPITSGDMMILLHEDIYQTAYVFINYYPGIIGNIFSIAFTLMMLSSISPYLLITPIALTPVLIYFSLKYNKATYNENQIYRGVDGELRDVISRITATEQMEEFKSFKPVNNKHTSERKKLSFVGNKYSTILNLIKIMIYIISCTVAGILAIKGDILIGEYLIFTAFINTIYTQIINLISNFISIQSCKPRVEKVKTLMGEYLNEEKA